MSSPSRPAVALNLTTNTPHNTRCEVNVGVLSILFSYGMPIGVDYIDGTYAWQDATKTQQKHLYQWRNRSAIKWVSKEELTQRLLTSLQTEAEALQLSASQENSTMTDRLHARTDDIDDPKDPVEEEVDALDNEDDDDLDDDDDFDDIDDDDEDDDDDLDFDDEDEFAGEDEDETDDDGELKENEY
jgi:hypothetical protein